jgi:hypothetical protein
MGASLVIPCAQNVLFHTYPVENYFSTYKIFLILKLKSMINKDNTLIVQ